MRCALLVRAFPGEGNVALDGLTIAVVAAAAMSYFLPSFDGDAVDFFETGQPVLDLLQARAAQIPDAFLGRPGRRYRWRCRPP